MADTQSMKIDIPGVDFTALARATIAAKFAESLVGADDAVRKIVIAAMERKVNDHGHTSNYSYENKTSFIEWMAQDLIRSAALEVVKGKVEALRPALVKAIEAELKRSTKSVAKALTESFIKQATNGYGVTVQVSAAFKERE